MTSMHVAARLRRRGLTLLEILVVLVLLGLAFALAAPSFFTTRAPDAGVQRVVDTARQAAVRRAEALTLTLHPDGQWQVERTDGSSRQPVSSGTFGRAHASSLQIRISPLGACMLVESTPLPPFVIDPVRCRLAVR